MHAITSIPVGELVPDPHNLRQAVDADAFKALAESVKGNGVYQPLIVRRHTEGFVVIDGHRRLAAAKLAGLTELPCVVVEGEVTLAVARRIALTVHLQNDPPHFLDTARAMGELKALEGCSSAQLARMLSVSPALVTKYLSVMQLPPEVLNAPGASLSALYDGHVRRQRVKKPDRRKRFKLKAEGFAMTVMADAKATVAAAKQWLAEMQSKVSGLADDEPLGKLFA
jgi:ParB/RepB/Spo0J family partition protein